MRGGATIICPPRGATGTVPRMPNTFPNAPAAACRVELSVNRRRIEATLPVTATLAELLRERLHLTGTKVACNQAACGACTVRLDGTAVFACHTLALQAHGRDVVTIEGLAPNDALTLLQQ